MAGRLVGSILILGLGATLTLVPRLFGRRRPRSQATAEADVTAKPRSPALPLCAKLPAAAAAPLGCSTVVLCPFGSPVLDTASGAASGASNTPTARKTRSVLAAQDCDPDTASKDQQTMSTPSADVLGLKQQLVMLKAMEEENQKLRAFMMEHLQASEKVRTLEGENAALAVAKGRLEAELETARRLAAAPAFALSSGDELQRFKGMLAARGETRSVCSDVDGLGGVLGGVVEGSTDGAATVADFAAASRRAPSFFKELAVLLGVGQGAMPLTNSRKVLNMSRHTSVAGSDAGGLTPRASRSNIAVSAKAVAVEGSNSTRTASARLDVSQMLDAWAGGGRL